MEKKPLLSQMVAVIRPNLSLWAGVLVIGNSLLNIVTGRQRKGASSRLNPRPVSDLSAPKSSKQLPTSQRQNCVSDGLRGICYDAILDPLGEIRTAIPDGAAGHFNKERPAASVSPVLQCADGIAKDRRRFAFVH